MLRMLLWFKVIVDREKFFMKNCFVLIIKQDEVEKNCGEITKG
jgi:hypothetical protein